MSSTTSNTTSNVTSQIQPQLPTVGVVRSVNSGDSLVIQDLKTLDAPKQEYNLSHLTVPRLGFHGTNDKPATKDTPFAWESREYLRKLCIGKKVHFYVDYVAPTGKKYITCYLESDLENSLNKQMISSGFASLFRSASGKENKKPEYLNLIELESEAISRELGIHNKNPIAINNSIRPIHTLNAFDLFNKLKGKPLSAVVEQIRNAASYRVVIVPSFHSFTIQLSGVQCPGYRKDASGTMQPEAFAVEAETFIMKNLLHRDVQLTLDTFDKQGNLYGTVICLERDVACELLKNGLGSYVAWSGSTRSAPDQVTLKNAEQAARDAKLRIWQNFSSTPSSSDPYPQEIHGKVVEIGNAGQIGIISDSRVEYKLALASVRVPNLSKPTDNENQQPKEKQQAIRFERYWAYEAKEWLRKRLIGQRVTAKLDFVRPTIKSEGVDLAEKPFYSIYLGKGNVSLGLVEAGLAKLTEHKGADNRAVDYEALVTAEAKAKKKNAGLFSNKDTAPVLNINDVSSDDKSLKAKAQKLLPHIRGIILPAVVDYVFSAQRVKLFVEKESCMINFSLSGVRVPKRDENEVLSNQALAYSREHLHQHDVSIQIDDIDKGGNFIGNLYYGNKNFALNLVEMGFASIYDPMNRLSEAKAFADAEDKAKSSRLNMWKDYDPLAEQRAADQLKAAEEEKLKQLKAETGKAIVRTIVSPTQLYIQYENSKNNDILDILENLANDEGSAVAFSPKAGDLVKYKSAQDEKWYRAKIKSSDSKIKLFLVDFGDNEEIDQSQSSARIRPLSGKLLALPPVASLVNLAFVKQSSNEDINLDAIDFLNDQFTGLSVSVDIVKEESGSTFVTLQDKQGMINGELLSNGLVKIDRNFGIKSAVATKLQEDENKAKKERRGIFRNGDIGSDDEDEFPRGGFKKGRGGKGRK
ncbi:hypothetical protein CYY_004878 [Polysphondylium violaceum]|uniref:Nuclease domain-containing protein n=1 Tax=Polysphondylium violaceum TaxID=133409 RepID=A0A8J4PV67_9MYCE|nr:hypothetical protein CYY_004878 [Polysphondylium violaceum]